MSPTSYQTAPPRIKTFNEIFCLPGLPRSTWREYYSPPPGLSIHIFKQVVRITQFGSYALATRLKETCGIDCLLNRPKRSAMLRRCPQAHKRFHVHRRGVPLVLRQAVTRVGLLQQRHFPVSGHLGNDRRRADGRMPAIPFYHWL